MNRFINGRSLRSYTKDAGNILDLFGTGVTSGNRGTLSDDVRSVYRDFQEVGKDFASVLSSEEHAISCK